MIKRIWKRDGSVSVTIILLIVPLFLFHAVLIDYARIRLAERETEHAARTAGRSLLAGYDAAIQRYGLYGLRIDDANNHELFNTVNTRNMTSWSSSPYFAYLNMKPIPEATRLQNLYSLANPAVFQRQMLEEMKYRAPISYTESILDVFKKPGTSGHMTATASQYEHAEELEALRDKLDEALDQAWEEAQGFLRTSSNLHGEFAGVLGQLNELSERIGLQTADSVRQSIRDVEEAIRSAENTLGSLRETVSNLNRAMAMLAMQGGAAEQFIGLAQSMQAAQQSISQTESSLSNLLARKQSLQSLLQDILTYTVLVVTTSERIVQAATLLQQAYEKLVPKIEFARKANEELMARKTAIAASSDGFDIGYLQSIPDYDMAFFSSYLTESGKLPAMLHAMKERWGATSRFSGEPYEELLNAVNQFGEQLRKFQNERQEVERIRSERSEGVRTNKAEQKAKLNKVLSEINKVLGDCGAGSPGDSYKDLYDKLQTTKHSAGLFIKYREESSPEAESDDKLSLKDATASVNGAVELLKAIPAHITGLRDKAFYDEYALTKFNYRTLGKETSREEGKLKNTLSAPQTHPLAGQEGEYILYGRSSCSANSAAAYGEMYLFFLGVRMMEGLSDTKTAAVKLGSPLLAFLAAAAEGAVEAWQDMDKLLSGDSVPVLKKLPQWTVKYKDLLRIFMLVHGNEANMTARMQALIELNTGADLTERTTYVQSTSSTSIRLWFMPSVFRLLGREGNVQAGHWITTKTVVSSY